MTNNLDTRNDEIDLVGVIKSLLKQKGLIFIITVLFALVVLAFQASKLAFYAPKQISYSVAIEFISADNRNYPNQTPFSASDLIAPVNLRAVTEELGMSNKMSEILFALSVKSGNQLINSTELAFLEQTKKKKGQPKELLEATNQALSDLKQLSATYVTLSLDLEKVEISVRESKQLLENLVSNWAKSAIDKGLIDPNISYPHVSFQLNEKGNIIDNYDYLITYAGTLRKAFKVFEKYSGVRSIQVDGHSLNDLQRKLKQLINKEIQIMRSYSYSQSNLVKDDEHLIEANIFAQNHMLGLKKSELEKKIASYNELINSLNSTGKDDPSQVSGAREVSSLSLQPQFEKGVLNELLDLGSKVSTIDLKKDLIERRLEASEELFAVEKEIAIVMGAGEKSDLAPLANRQKVINLLPNLLKRNADKVNEIQAMFVRMIDEYSNMKLQKGIALYSPLGSPRVIDRFGIPLKKTMIMLFIGVFLGLVVGLMVALIRTLFQKNRES